LRKGGSGMGASAEPADPRRPSAPGGRLGFDFLGGLFNWFPV